METSAYTKKRLNFLDEVRGFAVFCMVFYHAFYIGSSFFEWEAANNFFEFFMPVQPLFAGIFIFICGISCSLSKNNFKRGAILLGVAVGFTFVTAFVLPKLGFEGTEIYFGILHLLAVSILIYAVSEKRIKKLSPFIGIILCVILYAFTSGIADGELQYGKLICISIPESLYENNYLMPLGIYSPTFYSADYFPIFPDIFIFFAGAFMGRYFSVNGYPEWCYPKRVPFFGFLGRKSLLIYIIHMPIIFALAYAADYVINNLF